MNAKAKDIVRDVISIAAKHASNGEYHQASAEFNLNRAIGAIAERPGDALHRAIDSLGYSVGIFHADYKRAWGLAFRVDPARYG